MPLFLSKSFRIFGSMINPKLPSIYFLAMQAAVEASLVIAEVYKEDIVPTIKSDGSPVTKADLAASEIIAKLLTPTSIPILGEELEKDSFEVRSKWTENWCVDPLDGTKMFLLKNGEFAVNIAHVKEGKAVFGIIASPMDREILIGGPEYGVFILNFDHLEDPSEWEVLSEHTRANDPIAIICSRGYRIERDAEKVKRHTPHERSKYIRKGSALKFFDLALGTADIYPRFAPTMEWDIAAGQAILEALGGAVINANTQMPLTYNKESLYNPHFIAKTKAMME
jgi:3'(2'), 5'-bisphosphate nucleotidase